MAARNNVKAVFIYAILLRIEMQIPGHSINIDL